MAEKKPMERTVNAATVEITSERQEALKEAHLSSAGTDYAGNDAGLGKVDMHLEIDIIPVSDVDRAKHRGGP